MRRRVQILASLGVALVPAPTSALAAPADRASALAAWQAVQADSNVPAGWTGSVAGCVVGDESAESRAATLRTLNTLRSFAGLGAAVLDDTYNRKALAAALMMRAQNDLDHNPGPSWACYSAEGAEGAGSSNLFLGLSRSPAMVGYVDDEGISSLGHRRWVLDPSQTTFGTGSTGASDGSGPTTNALWVFGPSAPVAPSTLVAWPPAGWVPWDWVFTDWSVGVGNAAQAVDVSAVTVTVTLDGAPLAVSGIRDMGAGYGNGRTLAWNVALPSTARSADHAIDVTVSGVTVDGAPQPIAWRTNAFRPGAPAPAPSGPTTGGGTTTTSGGSGSPGTPTGTGGGTPAGGSTGTTTKPGFPRRPRITGARNGVTRVGARLGASVAIRGVTRLRYRWRRDGATIKGATRSTYRVTRKDRGKRLSLRVTGRTSAGRTVAATSATVRVRK